MLRLLICCLVIFHQLTALYSIEKLQNFDHSTHEKLFLEEEEGQSILVHTYSLKNISDKPVKNIFLSINQDRESEKRNIQQSLGENNFWNWWRETHCASTQEGAFVPMLSSVLCFPVRDVPMHGFSVKEFFYADQWHLVDQKNQLVYLALDNKTVAGYEEIADEPFLALRTKTTGLEGKYHFGEACRNFAHLNIFPQEFDASVPSEEEVIWKECPIDLFPQENITFHHNGKIEQTIILEERGRDGKIKINSSFPIDQIINLSSSTITLEDQEDLVAPEQTFHFNEPVLSLEVSATQSLGKLLLIGRESSLPEWKTGTNAVDLNLEENPTILQLYVSYEASQKAIPASILTIVNTTHYFDNQSPYFELESKEKEPQKVWWQISSTPDFSSLIPNFQAIQDFSQCIRLDLCTETFFNPHETYYFRIKELKEGEWSDWTAPFEFIVNKPEQVNPLFTKVGEERYKISWKPSQEEGIKYHIFASNAYDFLPSIYLKEEETQDPLLEIENNLITVTEDCAIEIGTEYAFYRIIAEKEGQYGIPSPLIRVYDYGLSIPRTVLQVKQIAPELYHVERIAFPKPYAHVEDSQKGVFNPIFELQNLEYYTPHRYVHPSVWEYLKPYFLPENHPVKPKLDRLFSKRVTQNCHSLWKAGFVRPEPMKFSKTIVSKNKHIPGYMFKLFCDDQKGISEWQRLFYRVSGSIYIQDALDKYNINHLFVVPKKWIYPLPPEPSPPQHMERKNFILIENELNIYTSKENNIMWKSPIINPTTLTWVYMLLQELGLNDSPYNFNMPITKDNRIAFIDTEHHHKWPVPFFKLWSFLSSDMGDFWNKLCEKGGP